MSTKTGIRSAMILLILLIGGGVTAVFTGHRFFDNDDVSVMEGFKSGAEMSMRTVRQTATRDGEVEWELEATGARLPRLGEAAELAEPKVTFYPKTNGPVRVTARTGVVETESKDIRVTGDVNLRNGDYRLRTESLSYQYSQRRFVADAPVRIEGEGMTMTAESASFDLNAGRAVFQGNVEGELGDDFSL